MSAETLTILFAGTMALAILVYAVLDGFDLGVGVMLPTANKEQADVAIASIGPFWDANETWLVLAVGVLLIAFPQAHGIILGDLYLPVFIMLTGLVLRGVAFDFRAKAAVSMQHTWDQLFRAGSIITALAQGFMLGLYVMGFERTATAYLFASLSGICVTAAYGFIGSAWLVMKTEGELQVRAATWCRRLGWLTATGVFAVSLLNPVLNEHVANRWFGSAIGMALLPVPFLCGLLFLVCDRYLARAPHKHDKHAWLPFACSAGIFFFSWLGLAYSYYPYLVPGEITIWQAASSEASMRFMFVGVAIVVPVILAYTALSYRVFRGKTQDLHYS